jgi:hypothetical protein
MFKLAIEKVERRENQLLFNKLIEDNLNSLLSLNRLKILFQDKSKERVKIWTY